LASGESAYCFHRQAMRDGALMAVMDAQVTQGGLLDSDTHGDGLQVQEVVLAEAGDG
jgi:hypothetical protein